MLTLVTRWQTITTYAEEHGNAETHFLHLLGLTILNSPLGLVLSQKYDPSEIPGAAG
jgi:hypothetical protein